MTIARFKSRHLLQIQVSPLGAEVTAMAERMLDLVAKSRLDELSLVYIKLFSQCECRIKHPGYLSRSTANRIEVKWDAVACDFGIQLFGSMPKSVDRAID